MNQLNSLIVEGNLVRDAELLEPKEGFKVCKLSLAVNRWYRNKNNEVVEEVSYFDAEAYGQYAEICSEKCKKGRSVRIVGRLKQNIWKDDSGKTVSKVFVVIEHIEYNPVSKKDGGEKDKNGQMKTTPQADEVEPELESMAVSF